MERPATSATREARREAACDIVALRLSCRVWARFAQRNRRERVGGRARVRASADDIWPYIQYAPIGAGGRGSRAGSGTRSGHSAVDRWWQEAHPSTGNILALSPHCPNVNQRSLHERRGRAGEGGERRCWRSRGAGRHAQVCGSAAHSRPRASLLTRARASRLQIDLKKLMVRSRARRLAHGAQHCTRPPGRVLKCSRLGAPSRRARGRRPLELMIALALRPRAAGGRWGCAGDWALGR